MADDIEGSLIEGGISPAAAKILANAISNAATGRLSTTRQLEDTTSRKSLRQIERNSRKHQYTNLDQPGDPVYRRELNERMGVYKNPKYKHTYQDSQPASANPTLTQPTTVGGKFVQSDQKTDGDVAQSEISLKVSVKGGQHARMNSSTGKVEAVPFSVEIEPKGLLEGEFVEEAGRTVLRLRVISTSLLAVHRKEVRAIFELDGRGVYMAGDDGWKKLSEYAPQLFVLTDPDWGKNHSWFGNYEVPYASADDDPIQN
jgi:hypothetical protein